MKLRVVNSSLNWRPANLGRFVSGARRYPLIPMSILVLLLVLPAIFADLMAPHNPTESYEAKERLLAPVWSDVENDHGIAPSWNHVLGTDKLGRDILSRIIHGARVSLSISLIAIFAGGLVGSSLGVLAGYVGGVMDHLIMRLVDIFITIPGLLLALVLAVVLGPSFLTVVFVVSLILWPRFARMARGETLSVRGRDFIGRAKVSGASNLRIMLRHVFPNVLNPLIILATLEIGHVILLEATLSFLGAGIPRPTPAWGLMVSEGRDLIIGGQGWWVSLFPGIAILLVVLSMNLFGDWLRDRLDPKLRNQ